MSGISKTGWLFYRWKFSLSFACPVNDQARETQTPEALEKLDSLGEPVWREKHEFYGMDNLFGKKHYFKLFSWKFAKPLTHIFCFLFRTCYYFVCQAHQVGMHVLVNFEWMECFNNDSRRFQNVKKCSMVWILLTQLVVLNQLLALKRNIFV